MCDAEVKRSVYVFNLVVELHDDEEEEGGRGGWVSGRGQALVGYEQNRNVPSRRSGDLEKTVQQGQKHPKS